MRLSFVEVCVIWAVACEVLQFGTKSLRAWRSSLREAYTKRRGHSNGPE